MILSHLVAEFVQLVQTTLPRVLEFGKFVVKRVYFRFKLLKQRHITVHLAKVMPEQIEACNDSFILTDSPFEDSITLHWDFLLHPSISFLFGAQRIAFLLDSVCRQRVHSNQLVLVAVTILTRLAIAHSWQGVMVVAHSNVVERFAASLASVQTSRIGNFEFCLQKATVICFTVKLGASKRGR